MPVDFNTFENLRKQGVSDSTIADQMASYNKSFSNHYETIKRDTGNDPRAVTAYLNYRFYGDANYSSPEPQKKGFVGRVLDNTWEKVKNEAVSVGRAVEDYAEGKQGYWNTLAQVGGSIASVGAAPFQKTGEEIIIQGAKQLYDNPITRVTGIKSGLDQVGSDIAGSEVFQAGMGKVGEGINYVQDKAEESPTLRSALSVGQGAFDVVDSVGMGILGKVGAKGAYQAAKQVPQITGDALNAVKGKLPFVGRQALEETEDVLTDVGKQLQKQGVDERLIKFAGSMSDENKMLAKEMTERANAASKLLPGQAEKSSLPIDIVGQQIKAPITHSVKMKDEIGRRLGSMVQSRYDEVFDVTKSVNKMEESLNKAGVLIEKGKVVDTGIFKGESRALLQRVVDFFGDDVAKTGKQIDTFRKRMFAELKDAKQKGALIGEDKLVDTLRMTLFEDVAQGDPLMTWLNKSYAELSQSISTFMKKSGLERLAPGVDIDDMKFADLKLGEFSARTLGRASSQAETELSKIIELAQKFGFSGNTDVQPLITYARNLDNLFDISPVGSLAGELKTAGAGANMAKDLVRGVSPTRAMINSGTNKFISFVDKMRGLSPEKRYELLLKMFDVSDEAKLIQKVKKTMGEDAAKVVDDLVPESTVKAKTLGKVREISNDDIAKAKGDIQQLEITQYIDEINNQIQIYQNEIDSLPNLSRYIDKKTGRLPEAGDPKSKIRIDDVADELGFEDSEALRDAYDRVMKAKQEIRALKTAKKEAQLEKAKLKVEKETLTPEERATGLIGGGGDNMPRTASQSAQSTLAQTSAKVDGMDNLLKEAKKYKSAEEVAKEATFRGDPERPAIEIKRVADNFEQKTVPLNKIEYDVSGRMFEKPNISLEAIESNLRKIANGDDLKPIIVNQKGEVIDGQHRAISYLISGKKNIPAYVADGINVKDFDNLATRLSKQGDSLEDYYGVFNESRLKEIWNQANAD